MEAVALRVEPGHERIAPRMTCVQSPSNESEKRIILTWTDHSIGKPVSLLLGADGNPLAPAGQRAQIKRVLELDKAAAQFFARRSPPSSWQHRREPLSPGFMLAEYYSMDASSGAIAVVSPCAPCIQRLPQATLIDFGAAVTALFKCTDNSWNSDVFSAIKEGSDAEVFCRLDVDSEVINEIDGWSSRRTALHVAAWEGRLNMCSWLLQSNARVNLQDYNGETPLHCAVQQGRIDISRLLLQHKADPCATTRSHQQTPLIYAARQGNLDICRLLVDSKADVAARDSCGRTALAWAVNRRTTHVAAFLRCVGATL